MHPSLRRALFSGLILALLLAAALPAAGPGQASAEPPPGVLAALEHGLQAAVLARQEKTLAFVLYRVLIDRVQLSADGRQALLWLALAERDSARVIASEPGLAIAELSGPDPADPAGWQFSLQVDEDWAARLQALPAELVNDDLRGTFLRVPAQEAPGQSIQAIGGYRLPWANGRAKLLEGSIAHFKIYFSCRYDSDCYYAYDFADGTMFPLVAARAGTVYTYYDNCPNGSSSCSNYLVLKDTSTEPDTYQLYLHIAYHSVPARLRSVGAAAVQGEYIANVDDTGYSTGHHLHFHVFTNFTTSYWGPSVDITFADVSVNSGRPRTCEEASRWPAYGDECVSGDWYTSGNAVPYPPSGALTAPQPFERVTQNPLTVSGWATDCEGIARIFIKARWGGAWHTLAETTQAGFSSPLDLCALDVPNGPLDLALTIEDREGNRIHEVGRRSLLLNLTCPASLPAQPACTPDDDEVALYSEPLYQGACTRLGVGEFNSPGEFPEVGNNNAASLQVGAEVRAVLFHNGYFGGREESFEADDPNLADNRIQADTLSSLKVELRTSAPLPPVLDDLGADAAASVLLAWNTHDAWLASGALDYQARLFGPDSPGLLAAQRDYAPDASWSLGSLAPGDYLLQVTARNSAGSAQSQADLTISPAELPAQVPQALPYTADFAGGGADWLADGGWQWQAGAWVFANPSAASTRGSLTSPPISLPAGGSSQLSFDFRADTEDDSAFWDQMRVQVAPQGGAFGDLWQITDQAQGAWLTSPALDLSAYAGQTVRVRFLFSTLDGNFNSSLPWQVDNVRLQAAGQPAACAEAVSNDSWPSASPLDSPAAGFICPNGDLDFYQFSAAAGGHLVLGFSGEFSALLGLYDASGSLLLEGPAPLRLRLPYSGNYYVQVRSAAHPGQGSPGLAYTLTREIDLTPPAVNIAFPPASLIPGQPFLIQAEVQDLSGAASAALYWHSGIWPGDWQLLNVDTTPADGFNWLLNPADLPGLAGGGLAVVAEDAAGNLGADWRVLLTLDDTPPTAVLQTLASPNPGSAVLLKWSASDSGLGLDHFDLQYRAGAGEWQTLGAAWPAAARQAWFLGDFGQAYSFRLRAFDQGGLASAATSAATVIESACTPDAFEDADDLPAGARPLDAQGLTANLCGAGDADTYQVSGTPGQTLLALAQSVSGGAAVNLELWQNDTLLAASSSSGPGAAAFIRWQVHNAEPYLLRVTPLAGVAGSQAVYRVMAFVPRNVYLPILVSSEK